MTTMKKHGGAVGRKCLLQIHTQTRPKESLLQAKIGLDNGVHFSQLRRIGLGHPLGRDPSRKIDMAITS
jgi:hypothetical protein